MSTSKEHIESTLSEQNKNDTVSYFRFIFVMIMVFAVVYATTMNWLLNLSIPNNVLQTTFLFTFFMAIRLFIGVIFTGVAYEVIS